MLREKAAMAVLRAAQNRLPRSRLLLRERFNDRAPGPAEWQVVIQSNPRRTRGRTMTLQDIAFPALKAKSPVQTMLA